MKKIGSLDNGDLLIQVTPAEWEELKQGAKPEITNDNWFRTWHKSEASKFFRIHRKGESIFLDKFRAGSFDGSLNDLERIVNDKRIVLYNIGTKGRARIKDNLAKYLEANQ